MAGLNISTPRLRVSSSTPLTHKPTTLLQNQHIPHTNQPSRSILTTTKMTDTPLTVPLLINGQEEYTDTTFDVISPYTNTPCWTSASATPQDAIRAVEAADAAFPTWSQTKPTARRDILLKAADLLEQRLEENAAYMRTEMGADEGASAGFVVPLAIRMLRDVAGRITSICGSVPVVEAEGQSAIVFKEAMGVILGIVPWYVPVYRSTIHLPATTTPVPYNAPYDLSED